MCCPRAVPEAGFTTTLLRVLTLVATCSSCTAIFGSSSTIGINGASTNPDMDSKCPHNPISLLYLQVKFDRQRKHTPNRRLFKINTDLPLPSPLGFDLFCYLQPTSSPGK